MVTVATIQGSIVNDAFYFDLGVNGTVVPGMILDTGAFELTFNDQVANVLGLPNLGNIQIGGVGGTVQAYQSVCTLQIGNSIFADVPCIIDPGFTDAGLFGLRFFVDNQLSLQLDTTSQVLNILSACC
ncbi:retropepsin-like aspartic protease [Paenibacillus filicis]|uniref:Retropepsin-like aspartic protease n=1 Tax=Paenibacillus gyeongsangnamensis TaxID=3388067 RepID=A0ABT4QJ67_9BACL|nr:retropepsin-like aspartic protease [Paenibacillus filicis]MCZ8516832.1 retropepsin-like aspartic protease [Paenibacillus filicis]